jgi:hypothetical protein
MPKWLTGRLAIGMLRYPRGVETYVGRALKKVVLTFSSAILGVIAILCVRDFRSWRDKPWEPFLGAAAVVLCLIAFRALIYYRAPALHYSLRRRGW